jgi:hypothetical protein
MRELLERGEDGRDAKIGKRMIDRLAAVIVEKAVAGDFRFVELLVERIDGRITDRDEGDTRANAEEAMATLKEILDRTAAPLPEAAKPA